ncbi:MULTISPECIES: MnhB domain-containing protein [unclassified Gemella]|uniref:MnhB domain-containing protein n=1 Tax=unclassified Gemella TaxID=2624949 RepID=UPI0010737488|nr:MULTISPECIES: MnhB domain-containing protein [unclassified Gemella]MBF0710705.1 Na(+)/H(+) antiporter subunit B [Gemella sp. GL1.1]MBF0746726.1 Na(+)/H(+) antiporter subunit B [Gemella sp. 19428wG2_WT2a]NYS28049.1 Na(+)/H(+) antiporter subunit B [Gemella sp. GL1]TFU60074.1 Na(+)/H(+) antiporter subunit B [Gemella sp. WT2a]
MKTNDLILKTLAGIIAAFAFILSIYLYFKGHFYPGGGFVGGLLCTMAIGLAMFTYGIDKVNKILPLNYIQITGIGVILAIATAVSGMLVGKNFFKHHFAHAHIPLIGEAELHTAAIFDLGVYLVVVGVLMTVILAFGKDGK